MNNKLVTMWFWQLIFWLWLFCYIILWLRWLWLFLVVKVLVLINQFILVILVHIVLVRLVIVLNILVMCDSVLVHMSYIEFNIQILSPGDQIAGMLAVAVASSRTLEVLDLEGTGLTNQSAQVDPSLI